MARIYTEQMESVLGPISQAISDLFYIVEQSRKQQTILNDLSKPSKAVLETCQRFSKVALEMVDSEDEIIAKEIPKAAKSLEDSALFFHEACVELKSSLDAQTCNKLEVSARGILEGTTRLLEIADEKKVKNIISKADMILNFLDKFIDISNMSDLFNVSKTFNHHFFLLINLSELRCKEFGGMIISKQFGDCLEILKKGCPTLLSSARLHIKYSNENTDFLRNFSFNTLRDAIQVLKELLQMKFYHNASVKEVSENSASILENIKKNVERCMNEPINKESIESILDKDFKYKINKTLEEAKKIIDACCLPIEKKKLEKIVQSVELSSKRMEELKEKLISEPENESILKEFRSQAKKLNEEIPVLKEMILEGLMHLKESLICEGKKNLLNDTTSEKTTDDLVKKEKFSKDFSSNLEILSNFCSDWLPNDDRFKSLKKAELEVNKNIPLFTSCFQLASKNPKESNISDFCSSKKKDLEDSINNYSNLLDSMSQKDALALSVNELALKSAFDEFKENHINVDSDKNIGSNSEQKMKEGEIRIDQIDSRLSRISEILNSESLNTTDENLKEKLSSNANYLSKEKNIMLDSMKIYLKNSQDSVALDSLKSTQKNVIEQVENSRILLGGSDLSQDRIQELNFNSFESESVQDENSIKKDEECKKEEQMEKNLALIEALRLEAAGEIVIVEKKEPTILFAENKIIGISAQKLHIKANQWDETNNDIIILAKKIAEDFNKMAIISDKTNSKGELILLSKSISNDSMKVAKMAKKYAMNCSDKRLREQIELTLLRMETIASQLKIISAVKAAHYQNEETDAQLTICSQNLMDTISDAVAQCHSASLKPINEVETLKWKKKIYLQRHH